jgi:tetratricopeptide (TPR) repeat protein
MLDNCGDSVGFPGAELGAACVDQGRLAGLYLQLYARRFTGRAYVSTQSRTMTIAFRDGTPVMVESSAMESSLADDLVERGILSRDEYAELIARVTEDLVENEDVAVCEHAVSLGFLSEEQIRRELSERVRSKLIQSLGLVDCEVELDDAPDALSGVAEYPQDVGATVYMGVRTFYDDEALRGYLPDLKRNYVRLVKSPAEIARFFQLDMEEVALLNAIDPQVRAMEWFQKADLETSHALALIGLLLIGGMCEFSPNAFVPPEAERSGVRSAAQPDSHRAQPSRAAMPAARDPRASSRAAIPAVREEVFEPRAGSRMGMPAVLPRADSGSLNDPRVEPNTMPASSRTEGSGAFNPPRRTEGSGAHNQPRRMIVEPNMRTDGSGAHNPPRRTDGSGAHDAPRRPSDASGAHNAFWRAPAADPSISRPRGGSAPIGGSSQPTAAPAQAPASSPRMEAQAESSGDAAAEALAEARARAREKRGAGYGTSGKSTDKASAIAPDFGPGASSARTPAAAPRGSAGSGGSTANQPVARSPIANSNANPRAGATAQSTAAAAAVRNLNPPQAPGPNSPAYQKAHLKELMQRKHGGPASGDVPGAPRRDPARELRHAQESLRDGQYARAEEQLRALVEQAPNDDVLRTYHMWAQFRASQALDPAQLSKLRDLAKRMVSDSEHAGFACYVLAHIYLADKKDEQAEKYFRKAHQLDKTNKDAERHIVILERRKQNANDADGGSQRKFLGISLGKKTE